MTTNFYREFEDKHRGSRELIKSRLKVYMSFINPLKQNYTELEAVDLGCGRGEWLELLTENNFSPVGVDLDDGMLAACQALGLKAHNEDALSYLKCLGDESQLVVSAFHLVEHIPFESLQDMVVEAIRVLKPGGILILETPNPENIVVASSGFYMDPTHIKPLPPELLKFVVEHFGFERSSIVRLQESPQLKSKKELELLDVLTGVSPDYAIVAQKKADTHVLESTKQAFSIKHGLSLDSLVKSYDQKVLQKHEESRQAIDQGLAQALAQSQFVLDRYLQLTAPFRWIVRKVRIIKNFNFLARFKSVLTKGIGFFLNKTVKFINGRPKLRHFLISVMKKTGLFNIAKKINLKLSRQSISIYSGPSHNKNDKLSYRASQVNDNLKTAIDKQRKRLK